VQIHWQLLRAANRESEKEGQMVKPPPTKKTRKHYIHFVTGPGVKLTTPGVVDRRTYQMSRGDRLCHQYQVMPNKRSSGSQAAAHSFFSPPIQFFIQRIVPIISSNLILFKKIDEFF